MDLLATHTRASCRGVRRSFGGGRARTRSRSAGEPIRRCPPQREPARAAAGGCGTVGRPVSGLVGGTSRCPVARLPTLARSGWMGDVVPTHRCGGSAGFAPASRFTRIAWMQAPSDGGTLGACAASTQR